VAAKRERAVGPPKEVVPVNSVNLSGRVDSVPRLMGMPDRDVCEF
jgi:hypothetical protein